MKEFKAESKKMLDLVINSIYEKKDAFLRELISNASDAYDRLILEHPEQATQLADSFEIEISFDKTTRTITVSDNGIGMSAIELEENLGTIAHSTSHAIKENISEDGADIDIIGQFGIGFYSSFMVADSVTVITRAFESDRAHKWESSGLDGYEITPSERKSHGTDVVLHLRKNDRSFDYDKFLSHPALKELVKRYSDFIRYPIVMDVTGKREIPRPEGAKSWEPQFEDFTEHEILNSMVPLWAKSKSEVSQEEYDSFYMREFDDRNPPLRTISMHARGTHNCDVLLFIPSEPSADFYSRDFQKGLKLYSSSVLIQEQCDALVSEAFGFLRGIVDTPDISLNLSRESMQDDQVVRAISSQIEKRTCIELENMRDNERDLYVDFFGKFGRIFKFAIYATFGAKNELLSDLLLFFTAQQDEPVTLKEYCDKMSGNQRFILYASGDSPEALESSPLVKTALQRGYDVLLCTEAIDEFCLMTIRQYDGYEIKNISDSDVDLVTEDGHKAVQAANAQNKDLLEMIRASLDGQVIEVTTSSLLGTTPACISARGPISLGMEKYFSGAPEGSGAPRAQHVLELNPNHKIFEHLRHAFDEGNAQLIKRYSIILHGQALLAEGLSIPDQDAYATAIYELM